MSANFAVNGKPAETELGRDFIESGNSIWTLNFVAPIVRIYGATLPVRVKDLAGNASVVERVFSVVSLAPPTKLSIAP